MGNRLIAVLIVALAVPAGAQARDGRVVSCQLEAECHSVGDCPDSFEGDTEFQLVLLPGDAGSVDIYWQWQDRLSFFANRRAPRDAVTGTSADRNGFSTTVIYPGGQVSLMSVRLDWSGLEGADWDTRFETGAAEMILQIGFCENWSH